MSPNIEALLKTKDDQIVKLLADNRELSEELRQCQSDKEFVWTLWKRLQVSSPDLSQAISSVMLREKEKCETKDRKVLDILQSKGEQIENLQDTVTSLKRELDKLVRMKTSLEGTRTILTTENEDMKRRNDILNGRLVKLEALGQNQTFGLKKSMEDMREQREELNDKVTKLLIDLQTARMESQSLEADNEQLKKQTKKLEEEKQQLSFKCQKLQRERESLSEEVINLKSDLSHYKDEENTARRGQFAHRETKQSHKQQKTHSEEQQNVILKLQSLVRDTQKVLKEQELSHKEELGKSHKLYSELARKYEALEKSYRKLEKVHDDLKQRVGTQDKALWKTEKDLKRSHEMATRRRRNSSLGDFDDLEVHVESQKEEIDVLRRRLKEKNVQLAEMRIDEDDSSPVRDNYAPPGNTFSPIMERIGRDKEKHQHLRPISSSPDGRYTLSVHRKLQATEQKLESTKHLLDLKKDELKQLKTAHDKRLNRLKEVQAQFREMKEVLHSYEKDVIGPRTTKTKKKIKRPNVSDLRQEDCNAVWNELAYYKRENRNLVHQKLSLEEGLDNLRVQAAMDKAKVQELNMCLKQEKGDLMAKLKHNVIGNRLSSTPKKKNPTQDQDAGPLVSTSATTIKHMVKNLERKLENASEDNRLLKKERNQLLKEISVLKEEIKSFKRDITESRQSGIQLRRDVVQLRHQLEIAEDKKLQAELEAKAVVKESENARASRLEGREEIHALRVENSDLRAELASLKAELREITNSLQDAEAGGFTKRSGKNMVPMLSTRASLIKLSSESARKHQPFLNQSINNLKDGLGIIKRGYANEITASDSDTASLGEMIVRAAISVPGTDVKSEDEDTLVASDSEPSHPKPSARQSVTSRCKTNELTALKQRLASMQTQCSTLMAERQDSLKQVSEEKDRNTLLESEVTGLQNRLKVAKASIQKLHREVEAISREKEELQRAMECAKISMPEPQKHSDTDYRLLENKMRMANSDANHYLEQIKKVKKENEEKVEIITGLREKVNKLERDVSMKRQLIEEQKAKIKSAEQMSQAEQNAVTDLEAELSQISEELTHKKNYIESLKKQVQAVGVDKARYEQSYNETKAQLEKRCEQVSVEQARKLEAEHLASRLENTVQQQLNTLASKSEQAMEKIQAQFSVSQEKNHEFSTCIQILSSQVLDFINHLRNHLRTTQDTQLMRESDSSMSRAQSIACSILDMSKADYDEMMTPVDSRKREDEEQIKSIEMRIDREWKAKVEEIAQETPPFAKSLNRLLWDKIQDAVHLAEEKCRAQYKIVADRT